MYWAIQLCKKRKKALHSMLCSCLINSQIMNWAVLWSTHYICSLHTPGKISQRGLADSLVEGRSGKVPLLGLSYLHKSKLMWKEFSFSDSEICWVNRFYSKICRFRRLWSTQKLSVLPPCLHTKFCLFVCLCVHKLCILTEYLERNIYISC